MLQTVTTVVLTSIVHHHARCYRDPHRVEDEALPSRVVCGVTTLDTPDVVTDRLDRDVKENQDQWISPAPCEFDQIAPHLAAPAHGNSDIASVHDLGQPSKDYGYTRTQTDFGCHLEANDDIAPHSAIPPLIDVVVTPDDCVDTEREVAEDHPGNERAGCDIPLGDVPYERCNAEEPGEPRKYCEGDGRRVDFASVHVFWPVSIRREVRTEPAGHTGCLPEFRIRASC